jgi:hypothetical protein
MHTTTTPEQPTMEPTTERNWCPPTPNPLTRAIDEIMNPSTARKFADAWNAQPKRTADHVQTFTALTGVEVANEDAAQFTRALLHWLNVWNIKLKHGIQIEDVVLTVPTPTDGDKVKAPKPAPLFNVLQSFARKDETSYNQHAIHLELYTATATDAHKLLSVELYTGDRTLITDAAQTLYSTAALKGIGYGETGEQIAAQIDNNADQLANYEGTRLIHAKTGQVIDAKPLEWRNVIPAGEAPAQLNMLADTLHRGLKQAEIRGRNVSKDAPKLVAVKLGRTEDAPTAYFNAAMFLEVSEALCKLNCNVVQLDFYGECRALKLTARTNESAIVTVLLMPVHRPNGGGVILKEMRAWD